jgi:hypothetical protein
MALPAGVGTCASWLVRPVIEEHLRRYAERLEAERYKLLSDAEAEEAWSDYLMSLDEYEIEVGNT